MAKISSVSPVSLCNTIEGITGYLEDGLEGLHKLANDRHKLFQSCDAENLQLNEFIVLGRYMLDTCANFSSITEGIPAEIMSDCPRVMTKEEWFDTHCGENNKSMTISYQRGCAYPGIKCSHCRKTWTIDDCHDVYIRGEPQMAHLHNFEGKTLAEFEENLAKRTDAHWCGCPETFGIARDTTHVIEKGDEVRVWKFKQHHRQCWIDQQNARELGDFTEIFAAAGFKKFNLEPIPNQYWPKGSRFDPPDWYEAHTHLGMFTVGWRKRVIMIEVPDLVLERCGNLDEFFENENVTKGPRHIHAWGKNKTIEYLMRILERNREEGKWLSHLLPQQKHT